MSVCVCVCVCSDSLCKQEQNVVAADAAHIADANTDFIKLCHTRKGIILWLGRESKAVKKLVKKKTPDKTTTTNLAVLAVLTPINRKKLPSSVY